MPTFDDLLGLPFVDGGRDPDRDGGLDCWGLFRLSQFRFGNYVPDFTVPAMDVLAINATVESELLTGRWIRVDNPEPGDAVLMAFCPQYPRVIQHFGTVIGRGKFIQTLEKIGVHMTPLNKPPWPRIIKEFRRWKPC